MLRSGSGGDEKAAASSLFNTAQKIASQLSPATPVPTPGATPQANFLNLPNINLQGILGALPGANNGVSCYNLRFWILNVQCSECPHPAYHGGPMQPGDTLTYSWTVQGNQHCERV